jgi:predicted PurR-regulated permease PerM
MSYVFSPLYRLLARHMHKRVAATLTMLSTVAIVAIPVAIVLIVSISQGVAFAQHLATLGTGAGSPIGDASHPAIDKVNAALAPLSGGKEVLTVEGFQAFIKETLPKLITAFFAIIVGFAGSVPALMTSIILYGFLFNSFLINSGSLQRIIRSLSPFDDPTNELYFERVGTIARASLQGQFLIAFIMGFGCALLMLIVGLGQYFIFFVIVYTLLGLVPLGTGILVIPIAIGAMLTGQVWEGIWMLALYALVIGQLDNFLRPRLIPKNAKLLPAITTLSTFCGLYYFGVIGIIYGPLIAILLTTTLETYMFQRERKQAERKINVAV